jgi:hypothetical protein
MANNKADKTDRVIEYFGMYIYECSLNSGMTREVAKEAVAYYNSIVKDDYRYIRRMIEKTP